MYGMVNRALQGYIVQRAGEQAWDEISSRVEAPAIFSDSVTYDDDLTYAIVGAASDVLEVSANEILTGFGHHWVQFTGREGWGPVFDMAGSDLRSFVEGLDELHTRVQASMTDSDMPSFSVRDLGGGALEVEYRSHRAGLAPMVIGLLEGLANHFDEKWSVRHDAEAASSEREIFVLEPLARAT